MTQRLDPYELFADDEWDGERLTGARHRAAVDDGRSQEHPPSQPRPPVGVLLVTSPPEPRKRPDRTVPRGGR
jgi:hypothetical protein